MTYSNNKEFITIYTAKMARKLLKMGYIIADIKADKHDAKRTVFVFRNENNLVDKIRELSIKDENTDIF